MKLPRESERLRRPPRTETLLSVVVPVYNEEDNVPPLVERLQQVLGKIGCDYEIIFALDPCTDATEDVILKLHDRDPRVKLLTFARRFGQPAATLAGLHYACGDACVVIDADLQDPPELIEAMFEKWLEGYDVVYAQRRSRQGETLVKRAVAYLGYALIDRISEVRIPRNTGDFRLMSRKVVDYLKQLKESHGFLRGLVALVGFKQTAVQYDRDVRFSGKGNYNQFLGSLKIGLNGIVGFSSWPLQVISVAGVLISLVSFTIGATYLVLRLLHVDIPWGNPTLVMLVTFMSGIQLLSLGIMGEYVGRIYDEVKQRPLFIVDRLVGFDMPARRSTDRPDERIEQVRAQ